MKRAILFLFILFAFPSLTQASLPNRKGKLERTSVIKFTDKQIAALKKIMFDDKGDYTNKNFPKAYRYISSQLSNMKSRSNQFVDEGTIFWFNKADNINESVGWSSYMVRTYTTLGMQLADRDVGDLQKVSDDIAINVLSDVIEAHGVPPLQNILARDIAAAMDIGGIKDLAGWGGSFFYWDMPLVDHNNVLIKDPIGVAEDDYLTLGDYILRDSERSRRFIMTSVLCISYTPYLTGMSDIPGLIKALRSVKNLPDEVRLPIIEGVSEIDSLMGRILKAVD